MNFVDPDFQARSRQAFSTVGTPTLGEVRIMIVADKNLTPIRQRDLLSALARIPALCGKPLDQIHCTPAIIRNLLKTPVAARVDISHKTLANINSAVRFAVRHYARDLYPAVTQPRALVKRSNIAPAWRKLLTRISVRHQRTSLSRLARFCSAMNIAPGDVDQDALLGLHEALEGEELVKNPRAIIKNTISNWNRCRREIPEWPHVILNSPFKKTPYTFSLPVFEDSFQADVRRWRKRADGSDILDKEAPPEPLRPATVESRVLQIRQFGSALVHRREVTLKELMQISNLFEKERFESGIRFFLERQRGKTSLRLYFLATALRNIAQHYCNIDEVTLGRMDQICGKLNPKEPRSLTSRNRKRLGQFDNPANVRKLMEFPENQILKARKEKNQYRGAKRAEIAAAVVLLTHCGLRMGCLRALELVDFAWTKTEFQGRCFLSVPAAKTKTNRGLDFELSPAVIGILRDYLVVFRPRLPGFQGTHLFPGVSGGMSGRHSLREGIERRLLQDAGLEMHPHLFRHVLAKIVVEQDPAAYVAVSQVLGHTRLNTTLGSYLGTETKAASKYIDRLLNEAYQNDEQT